MKKKTFTCSCKHVAAVLCLLFMTLGASAQTTMYIANANEVTFTPGSSETVYLQVAMESSEETIIGYQTDVILPDGLEIAYYEGELDVYIDDQTIYPSSGRNGIYHSLSFDTVKGGVRVLCVDVSGNRALKNTSGVLFNIGVVATPYLKPGEVEIQLNGTVLSTAPGVGPTLDDQTSVAGTAEATSSVTLKVTQANKFGTAMLPFAVNSLPDGLKAYSCSSIDGDALVLTPQTTMKAYTPYVIYSESGYEGTVRGDVDASLYQTTVTDGLLTGTIKQQSINGTEGNYYVLQNKGDGTMFYQVGDSEFSIPAGRCWLNLSAETAAAQALAFRFGDATGISAVEVAPQHDNAPLYDLSGRKVKHAGKGIYISNGQKIMR